MTAPMPRAAAERDRCAALLRAMAAARGDADERRVLEVAAKNIAKCPACEGCGMDDDSSPCKSCAETTA